MSCCSTKRTIPTIDMAVDEPDVLALQLVRALTNVGFATLVNHSIPRSLIESAFLCSKTFFSLPDHIKQQYNYQGVESNRGYIGVGLESHSTHHADRKETFDIGFDNSNNKSTFVNRWPTQVNDDFPIILLEYFEAMDALHLRIMKLLGIGLKLNDTDTFVKRCRSRHENLRLLHYPPVTTNSTSNNNGTTVRGNVHTDFGTITLLTQDDIGGLRAQSLDDGSWMDVPPISGSIVLNVGDMLQRWTNDILRATPHQVVGYLERWSIAFFCNADKDTIIDCLHECIKNERPARYSPVKAHDYLEMRLAATISPPTNSKSLSE